MVSDAAPSEPTFCDSCGDETDDVVTVRRVYVSREVSELEPDQAAAADGASITRADALERWCFPCRTMYPHEIELPNTDT
jgi:hypothetical protein